MINFEYARASDVADAVRQIAADPAAKFIAGGTNLIDLMKDRRRAADAADRHHAPAAQQDRGDRRRRPAHRRARAQHRPRLPPADRAALSAAVERDPGRRVAAAAQHGLDRRQPAAADALPLLLRHGDALQQARAGQRLLGHRRHQPHPRDPRHERACIATHPSDMCVALAALEAKVHVTGPAASAHPVRRFPPAARRHAAARHQPRGRRDHHGDRAAAEGLRDELHLPEDPRPAVLCVRAGVGRGRRWSSTAARSRRRASRSAASRTSPGATRGRSGTARRAAAERRLHARGRHLAARRQGLRAQHLQDRAGAPRHRPRADAGRARHAAIAIRQEDPVSAMAPYIGTATSRVDGRAKVTGAAKYAAEFNVPASPTAASSSSTIAKGRITRIDTSEGARVEGVLDVLTHENRPQMADRRSAYKDESPRTGRRSGRSTTTRSCSTASRSRWSSPRTSEIARFAASLVRVEYDEERTSPTYRAARARPYRRSLDQPEGRAPKPRRRRAGIRRPPCATRAEYHVPIEHHNPMELFASTAIWDGGGKLTVYDKTQGVQNVQRYLCGVFGMKPDEVRVMSPFGGGVRLGAAPAIPGGAGRAGGARAASARCGSC